MTKTVAEEYAELYHYTTAEGLHGIITSQYLRATNISFLNDAEERTHYLDRRMPSVVERAFWHGFEETVNAPKTQTLIEKHGGLEKAVMAESNRLITAIRKVADDFNEPYVVSFCGTKDPRIAQHGLLSQWRGYGADGGYAIVFDTKGLESLLQEEVETYMYRRPSWFCSINYHDGENSDEEFQKGEEILNSSIVDFLKTGDKEKLWPIYGATNFLSCLTKHEGFREEKEVRVVVIRPTEITVKDTSSGGEARPVRFVHHHSRNGKLVPYIRLFEGITSPFDYKLPTENIAAPPNKKLLIKAIIVGPHPDKEKRGKAVGLLLKQHGIDAEVIVSDIPYLPR